MTVVYGSLAGYLIYALAIVWFVWRSPAVPAQFPIVTHAVDMVAFPVLIYFTEGPGSPFFVYFVFLVLCASVRWQWRGILWTAGISLLAFVGMGAYAARVLHEEGFDLGTFLIRSVFLGVVAALMGCAGLYEQRLRREMFLLASWPRVQPRGVQELMREALEHAAAVLDTRRVLAVWEEGEEPWVHVASWSGGEFEQSREPPGAWEPLVAPRLAAMDFLCPDLRGLEPPVLYASRGGLRRGRAAPLHPGLRDRFRIRSVLSVVLRAESLEGRLFWVDKKGMTADDLLLGEVVARQVAAGLDRFYLLDRLQSGAAAEERVRLARDLHDGLLQSLTAVALQLQAVHSLIAEEPKEAARRLFDVQRLIAAEQRDLRSFLRDLRPGPLVPPDSSSPLETRLEELVQRVKRQWGIEVELKMETRSRIPETLGHHAYLMVHEAMVNAARHGQATAARVELETQDGRMRITVADNGHGFPFRGRYDYAALVALKRGPVSLKERVDALGGSLAIESAESGASVEISVPLRAPEP